MKRHQHMVDLLRPELNIKEEVFNLQHKHELTLEDLDLIVEKADLVKRAAEVARRQRYGK